MLRLITISLISLALTGAFAVADTAKTATKATTTSSNKAATTSAKGESTATTKTATATTTTKTETKGEAKSEKAEPAKAGEIIDINTATKKQLIALPGIGEVKADLIIKGRPYVNKTQLKTKGGLSEKDYEKIAELVIAKQAK